MSDKIGTFNNQLNKLKKKNVKFMAFKLKLLVFLFIYWGLKMFISVSFVLPWITIIEE